MHDHPDPVSKPARPAIQRWRLVVEIAPEDGDGDRGARQAAWEAGLRHSGLPIAGLDADPPRPRTMAAAPLAASIAGEAELIDVWLTERLPRWSVRATLEGVMPPGHRLADVFDVWLGEAPLPGRVMASVYRVELGAVGPLGPAVLAAIEAMLAAPALPRERRKGEKAVTYDMRPFITGLEAVDRAETGSIDLRVTLLHDPERGIGRPDDVLAELWDRIGTRHAPTRIVRERLVLGPERATPPPAAGRGPRRQGPRIASAR